MYVLQRVTAIVALLFIGWHLINFWLPIITAEASVQQMDTLLAGRMSSTALSVPWFAFGYMIGIAACALHFANGIWSMSVRWGIVATRRARTRSAWLAALLGAVVFAWGANTIVFLATGWQIIGPTPSSEPDTTVCQPARASTARAATSTSSGALPPTK